VNSNPDYIPQSPFAQSPIQANHTQKIQNKIRISKMKTSEIFPARYLKAGDYPAPVILMLDRVTWEKMHNSDGVEVEKIVLYFQGLPKGLVLSKTNRDVL
jgi:hypothetical protein